MSHIKDMVEMQRPRGSEKQRQRAWDDVVFQLVNSYWYLSHVTHGEAKPRREGSIPVGIR